MSDIKPYPAPIDLELVRGSGNVRIVGMAAMRQDIEEADIETEDGEFDEKATAEALANFDKMRAQTVRYMKAAYDWCLKAEIPLEVMENFTLAEYLSTCVEVLLNGIEDVA
jgi:hypothetical protein